MNELKSDSCITCAGCPFHLKWYQLEVENKMRVTIRRINLSLENESLQTSDRQLNTEERENQTKARVMLIAG